MCDLSGAAENWIIKASGQEFEHLNSLKSYGNSLILPLNFPKPYDVSDPALLEKITLGQMRDWNQAPTNPAKVAAAKIPFAITMDGASLKLPIFGPVIAQSTISRIALIKANLFAAGVDVLEILDIATSSTSNTLYIEALERVKRGVFSGEDMSKLCANEKMFPDTYSQLIAVGERTGNLEEMFTSIANYYEEEFDNVVGNISTMIEPLSMVIIGGIVGVLLIAMYLPIFNAGSAIG
mgnify:CR=1 FL=1